jgi:hypothetical protein
MHRVNNDELDRVPREPAIRTQRVRMVAVLQAAAKGPQPRSNRRAAGGVKAFAALASLAAGMRVK